jgi:hypothetical protein
MSTLTLPKRSLLAIPVLLYCSLFASCSGSEPAPPALIEAEAFDGTLKNPDYGTTAASAWGVYSRPDYSGAQAALTTKVGATIKSHVPEFRKGNYVAEVTVYSYAGTERNTFEIELGGVRQRVSFGGADFPRVGLIQLSNIYFENPQNDVLTIKALAVGQLYLIVDNITVTPVEGAVPKVQEPWMK